jgi:hypothetical protein
MAVWTIIRVYEVSAQSQIEATDRMLEAILVGREKYYHVKDIIRAPEAKPGAGVLVSLEPPRGFMALLREQLLGSRDSKQTKR